MENEMKCHCICKTELDYFVSSAVLSSITHRSIGNDIISNERPKQKESQKKTVQNDNEKRERNWKWDEWGLRT